MSLFSGTKKTQTLGVRMTRMFAQTKWLSEKRKIEMWIPFLFMGVKVSHLDPNWRSLRLKLPLNTLSRNAGGVLFGGFQACLADPIAALATARRFKTHASWTRSMTLDFRHGADTDLELRFEFPEELEKTIEAELAEKNRATPSFQYGFYNARGELCTLVTNVVAIRPVGYEKASSPPADKETWG